MLEPIYRQGIAGLVEKDFPGGKMISVSRNSKTFSAVVFSSMQAHKVAAEIASWLDQEEPKPRKVVIHIGRKHAPTRVIRELQLKALSVPALNRA